MAQLCPCHSQVLYKNCCEPFHKGKRPLTPVALMRSRYAAYSLGKISYVIKTEAENERRKHNLVQYRKELKQYCQQTQFIGLNILEQPTPTEAKGMVTFHAVMYQNGRDVSFTERSWFEKINGRWLYTHGDALI